jgi:hypothetical protein
LAFSVFVLAVAEKMPETSEDLPLIGIYLTTVMTLTSISIIFTVIMLNFHHRGPLSARVPDWARRLILGKLARFLRMKLPSLNRINSTQNRGTNRNHRATMVDCNGSARLVNYDLLNERLQEINSNGRAKNSIEKLLFNSVQPFLRLPNEHAENQSQHKKSENETILESLHVSIT